MIEVLGYGLFVLVTVGMGWGHPKGYVKGYSVVCFFWELICTLLWWGLVLGQEIWLHMVWYALTFLPLIPIWYWEDRK